jgi:hypothetical protein
MKDDRPIRTLTKCLGLNAALMLRAVWPEQAPQRDALVAADQFDLDRASGKRDDWPGFPLQDDGTKLRLAQAAMTKSETRIAELCAKLGVIRETLYRLVTSTGELRPDGEKLRAHAQDPMFWSCPRKRGLARDPWGTPSSLVEATSR